jgi:hypothetical protein
MSLIDLLPGYLEDGETLVQYMNFLTGKAERRVDPAVLERRRRDLEWMEAILAQEQKERENGIG